MTILLILAVLFVLLLGGVPVAFALGGIGLGMLIAGGFSPLMAPQALLSTLDGFILLAVPLFLLMSNVLLKGGVGRDLFAAVQAWVGHWPGGLAVATILSCGIFAAISGSSVATAATIGTVAIPEMISRGYGKRFVYGLMAAGGTLGILIPPSVILVIYGLLTETSIGKLFIAGIIPGILGIVFYLVAVQISVFRNPAAGPAGRRFSLSEKLQALRGVWSVLLLFFLVIGGLYGALDFWPINLTFSPTEAAGMGAMGAFLIALFRGSLTVGETITVLKETATTTAQLFSVLIGAWIFSNFVNYAGLPEGLKDMITTAELSPWLVMTVIILIYVALGCVFESLSMLLLTVPIFFPIVIGLGFDPVWFGIIVVVVTEISLITPPVGLNVFILKSVVGDISVGTIFRGVTPFWMMDIVRLVILLLFPWLVLFLPSQM